MCERSERFEQNHSAAMGYPSDEYLHSIPDTYLPAEYRQRKKMSSNGKSAAMNEQPVTSSPVVEIPIFSAASVTKAVSSESDNGHGESVITGTTGEVKEAMRMFPILKQEALRDLSKFNGKAK